MSASNFNNLQMTVGIDPQQANKSLHKVAGTAQKQVEKVAASQETAVDKVNKKTDEGEQKVGLVARAWGKVNGKIVGAAASAFALSRAVGVISDSMKSAVQVADVRQGFFGFGGDLETIQRVDKALLGTVKRIDTLKQLREAAGVGLTNRELVDMAKSSAFMASQLGESKTEMLQMAAAGKLNETVWDKMGRSLKTVEQEIQAAQVRAGRGLTDTEKQALTIRLFIKEARRASGGFTANVSQASDQFARMGVQLQNVKERIGKQLLPIAVKFLKFISSAIDKIGFGIKTLSDPQGLVNQRQLAEVRKNFQGHVKDFKTFTKTGQQDSVRLINALHAANLQVQNLTGRALKGKGFAKILFGSEVDAKRSQAMLGTWRKIISVRAKLEQVVLKDKSNTAEQARLTDRILKLRTKLFKLSKAESKTTSGSKTFSQARMEALQERQGRQAALRAQLRNFTRTALQAAQKTGGPVARLLGGLQQYSEQLLIVQSTWPRLADQVIGKSHVQLKQMREQGELSGGQLKAALLLNQFRQAGTANLRKLMLGEKALTEALQASIAPASDVAQLAAIRSKETKTQKTVTETIVGLQTAQRLLAFEKDKHQRNALELMFKEADKLKTIGKERLKVLKIQRKLVEAAIQERRAKTRLELDKGSLDVANRLLQAQTQLAELQGKDTARLRFKQAENELLKIEFEIRQKHIDLRKQEADLLRAKGNAAEFELQRTRIEHTKSQIKQLEKLHGIQMRINKEQTSPAVASIMAKQTKQFTDGLIQGIGGSLVDIWGTIFAGENIGAALGKIMFKVFESIGDTLIAGGTQTMLMGFASLVNPWIGANPAAIGVGAGMIGAGSLIKAGSIAAALSLSNSQSSGASAPASAPVQEPQSPARSPIQSGGQVVINAMLVDPYFEGNMEGRMANLARQMNQHLPRAGVPLAPSILGRG